MADTSRRRARATDAPPPGVPERVAGPEPTPECTEVVATLVGEIEPRIDELADRMAQEIHAAIPEVEQTPGLLDATRASCRSNLILLFARMRQGADPRAGGVPAEALEYAQAFVRQGVSLATLLRFRSAVLTPPLIRRQRRNLTLITALFFLLFYTFPASMVLYWTSTNSFQLLSQELGRLWRRA